MVSTMNALTEGITRPYVYKGGDVGYEDDNGKFVSFKTFSGTERALVQMALSVTLASTSEFRLAVIDELGRFDKKNKERILENVTKMVDAGFIDQFIGVDVDWENPPEGVTIINA
jgi:NADPH:quinone reductase-like Zn-dependent oxidoreductase